MSGPLAGGWRALYDLGRFTQAWHALGCESRDTRDTAVDWGGKSRRPPQFTAHSRGRQEARWETDQIIRNTTKTCIRVKRILQKNWNVLRKYYYITSPHCMQTIISLASWYEGRQVKRKLQNQYKLAWQCNNVLVKSQKTFSGHISN